MLLRWSARFSIVNAIFLTHWCCFLKLQLPLHLQPLPITVISIFSPSSYFTLISAFSCLLFDDWSFCLKGLIKWCFLGVVILLKYMIINRVIVLFNHWVFAASLTRKFLGKIFLLLLCPFEKVILFFFSIGLLSYFFFVHYIHSFGQLLEF
jgi:hypothetical protein